MMNKMKKVFALMMTAAIMLIGTDKTIVKAADDYAAEPRIHYEYDIPNFTLDINERAYTTRYGYGFDVSTEGLNHNDFDLTFKVEGSGVKLKIAVLTLDNYVNGLNTTYYMTKTVTGAGTKSVSFNDLEYGKYVIKWINTGSSSLSVKNAHLSTSY